MAKYDSGALSTAHSTYYFIINNILFTCGRIYVYIYCYVSVVSRTCIYRYYTRAATIYKYIQVYTYTRHNIAVEH